MNEQGLTELHLACYHGELDWVQNCLDGGLDVHARANQGYTPLHWVVDMGLVGSDSEREAIVVALIAAGADVKTEDNNRETVLDVARRVEADYLIALLLQG